MAFVIERIACGFAPAAERVCLHCVSPPVVDSIVLSRVLSAREYACPCVLLQRPAIGGLDGKRVLLRQRHGCTFRTVPFL